MLVPDATHEMNVCTQSAESRPPLSCEPCGSGDNCLLLERLQQKAGTPLGTSTAQRKSTEYSSSHRDEAHTGEQQARRDKQKAKVEYGRH
jgi:hypothetical protein